MTTRGYFSWHDVNSTGDGLHACMHVLPIEYGICLSSLVPRPFFEPGDEANNIIYLAGEHSLIELYMRGLKVHVAK